MKKLLILLLLLCSGFGLRAGNVFIVAVGIADYPGTEADLTLPANDARAMYRLYLKYAKARAVLITDQRATTQHILTSAKALFAEAREDDIVVFFFSGHGYPGGFATCDGQLPYEEVRALFASCRAANKMIFADACFAGKIRENGTAPAAASKRNGILLFLSSRDDETSIESPQMRNGFFTACLLRCLKGGADRNRDRVITAKELFTAVSQGVRELSNDEQHPVMWGNFKDEMPVMRW